jgi:hypothetical protein
MTLKSTVGNGIKKMIRANILTGTIGRDVAQAVSRGFPQRRPEFASRWGLW